MRRRAEGRFVLEELHTPRAAAARRTSIGKAVLPSFEARLMRTFTTDDARKFRFPQFGRQQGNTTLLALACGQPQLSNSERLGRRIVWDAIRIFVILSSLR